MCSQSFISTWKLIKHLDLQIETSLNKNFQESVNALQSSTQESKALQEKLQEFQTMVIKM